MVLIPSNHHTPTKRNISFIIMLQTAIEEDDKRALAKRRTPDLLIAGLATIILGLLLLCFGIYIYYMAKSVFQIKMRYDDQCLHHCALQFNLSQTVEPPVYLYYEIQKFYQNHQIYLESFSFDQLQGKSQFRTGDCWPAVTNGQMKKFVSLDFSVLNQSDTAIPCGLIAKTVFNDRYSLHFKNGSNFEPIEISHEDISWTVDREKYKNVNRTLQWADMENEHFQVWMRVSPTNKFKKLWGVVKQSLKTGVYRVIIHNSSTFFQLNKNEDYDITQIGGKKLFVLSTLSTLGGQQTVLVLGYIFTGMIFILIGMFILFLRYRDRKTLRYSKVKQ